MSNNRSPKRIAIPQGVSLRGLNAIVLPNHGSWTDTWGPFWDWAGWIKPQLDLAISLGVNAVRFIGGPGTILNGDTTRATYLARQKLFVEYCRDNGMFVYACAGDWGQYGAYGITDWNGTVKDEMVAYAAFLHPYNHIIGMDVNQEGFYGIPGGWTVDQTHTQNQTWFAAIRAVTDIPLTCSMPTTDSSGTASMFQDATNIGKMSAYADFLDYHIYYPGVTQADTNPAFGATTLQYLIGESGASLAQGSTVQIAQYTAIKNLMDGGRFVGAFAWAASDQGTPDTYKYGLTDASFVPRTYLTDIFQTWTKTNPPMSDFFIDTFRGGAGSLNSAHTPDYGATALTPFNGDQLLDGTGFIYENPGALGYAIYHVTPPSADYAVQQTFKCRGSIQGNEIFILATRITPVGQRYEVLYNGAGTDPGPQIQLSSSVTGVIGTNYDFTAVANQLYTFRIECLGTFISAFLDGVLIISGTDSSLPLAGWIGYNVSGVATGSIGPYLGTLRALPIGGGSAILAVAAPTLNSKSASTVSLTASPSGGISGYTYQWSRGGTPIAGATSATLNDTGRSSSTTYVYTVTVTDASSASVISASTSVTTSASSPYTLKIVTSSESINTENSTQILNENFSALQTSVAGFSPIWVAGPESVAQNRILALNNNFKALQSAINALVVTPISLSTITGPERVTTEYASILINQNFNTIQTALSTL